MTTRKHFEQLVRERMRRTGERYTVAARTSPPARRRRRRRGRVGAARRRPRGHRRVRQRARRRGHRRAPQRRAAERGDGARLGGGLGAGYILWEFAERGARILVLGFRRQWQYPARWAAETAERLGLHADLHETGGAVTARRRLDAALDRGVPAIIWADPYRLGHRHPPAWLDGHGGGPVVAYARAGDAVLIDDRSAGRLSSPRTRWRTPARASAPTSTV